MTDQLLIIIGVTCLVMVSPGPDMVIVMRNTFAGGREAGLQTSLGVLAGNLVHIGYCVVGIGLLISQSIVAFSVLKYLGAAYLVYLGIASLLSDRELPTAQATPDARSNRSWFLQGFINNLLNPKGTLFYLGVFTVVITPGTTMPVTLLLIATMMLISAGFWLLFVGTLDRPFVRRLIARSQRAVQRIFGALLIFLGARVALMDR